MMLTPGLSSPLNIGLGSGSGGVPPLLDSFSNVAAAYSLRKLRTAYAGQCVRLRRDSDNAESDFGFVANVVDTAAITTWLGGANGFGAKFYDQSGNGNDLAQATALNQMKFNASDVAFQAQDGSDYFETSAFNNLDLATNDYSIFVRAKAVLPTALGYGRIVSLLGATTLVLITLYDPSSLRTTVYDPVPGYCYRLDGATWSVTEYNRVVYTIDRDVEGKQHLENNLIATNTDLYAPALTLTLLRLGGDGDALIGTYSTLIVCRSVFTAGERTSLQAATL